MPAPPTLDHLVYAGPELAEAIAAAESLLGIRAVPGGAHPAWGTRNALIRIGPAAYLEVIGPDPERAPSPMPRVFGIATLDRPRLVTWAVRAERLGDRVVRLRTGGIDLGPVASGSRRRPDGSVLSWQLTDPFAERHAGLVPFLINWGDTPHPAASLPPGPALTDLLLTAPDPEPVRHALARLDLPVEVRRGEGARLAASFTSERGPVRLT